MIEFWESSFTLAIATSMVVGSSVFATQAFPKITAKPLKLEKLFLLKKIHQHLKEQINLKLMRLKFCSSRTDNCSFTK